jgi:adenosylcobalamin-dependent ribonucleoside-triphosphate reductase
MYLTPEFLAQYNENPNWPSLMGQFVYLRTYSRFIPHLKRRETWKDTVKRVVEYSISLDKSGVTDLKEQAELLFDYMFNLKVFPAGRTLWTGGTEAAKKYPLSNFNCSFMIVDDFQAFYDAFYLMMLGTGVGFRVLPEDVKSLPRIKRGLSINNVNYVPVPAIGRQDRTELMVEHDSYGEATLWIGDSKEGWVDGLRYLLDAFSAGTTKLNVVYNWVRPAGEQLKTFGGRASGPSALSNMYSKIVDVLNEGYVVGQTRDWNITTVQAMDIMNLIGEAVVVGGVRRSSEITLFDINDNSILDAKLDLWTDPAKADKRFRSMSNNSVFFTEKPTEEQLKNIFSRIVTNGEPGFINATAAAKRRPNYAGTNPCAEILLADNGVCNLSEVNMRAFVHGVGTAKPWLDYEGLSTAVGLATSIGVRMATLELELPHWNRVQARDRLTGVSITGYVEAMDALGVDTTKSAADPIRVGGADEAEFWTVRRLLYALNRGAQNSAYGYAELLRIPPPLLVTCVKPSGTLAQLPTVSSGAHASYAPLYVRRVRISSQDPLAMAMKAAGYPIYPEATSCMPDAYRAQSPEERENTLRDAHTWVVEFPIKTSAKRSASAESAVDQLHRYFILQENWSDHNTSITISFEPSEIAAIIALLLERWDDYIGVSFLPKFTSAYPLMPYEEITEEEYLQRSATVSTVTGDSIIALLTQYENIEVDDDLGSDCEGGACPIR